MNTVVLGNKLIEFKNGYYGFEVAVNQYGDISQSVDPYVLVKGNIEGLENATIISEAVTPHNLRQIGLMFLESAERLQDYLEQAENNGK